jgi:hypothetical protein
MTPLADRKANAGSVAVIKDLPAVYIELEKEVH